MNTEIAHLLGMIAGNGHIRSRQGSTIVSIDIPHKKQTTESGQDVGTFVKASVADFKEYFEPVIDERLNFTQNKHNTTLSFEKSSTDFLMQEIRRLSGGAASRFGMSVHPDIFNFSYDQKISYLQGFADVTGYIRKSNVFFNDIHRVYIEIPRNWQLVIDISTLLKQVDVPVQNIDWAHPNMRDGNLRKYNEGNTTFWNKEHQIKITAVQFRKIGFLVSHKQDALERFANITVESMQNAGKDPEFETGKYYWETRSPNKIKMSHPEENSQLLPANIRGMHFNSWKEIAEILGYHE